MSTRSTIRFCCKKRTGCKIESFDCFIRSNFGKTAQIDYEQPFNQVINSHCNDSKAFHKFKRNGRDMLGASIKNSKKYLEQQELKKLRIRLMTDFNR